MRQKPNVIVILTDDQGWEDAACYGAAGIETPNLDRLAATGVRCTDFYAGHPACTPSRASLLTGCYPVRVSMPVVTAPSTPYGLNPDETTIAKALQSHGYATACVGKWHLGTWSEVMPLNHGFDEYFGLKYSNDMWTHHPHRPFAKQMPPLKLVDGEEEVGDEIVSMEQQDELTTLYTDRCLDFIERKRDEPFFLYLAHNMPHVPLGVSDKFRGKSGRGLYGDVIMEIDWSVGQILDKLEELGLRQDTLVVFTSDNGPWLSYGEHAGRTGPYREGKGTTFEGGPRVIGLASMPGTLAEGVVSNTMLSAMDILPTVCELTGAPLPEKPIDGKSALEVLKGDTEDSPHETLLFHHNDLSQLQAVRSGKWKLHFPHAYRSTNGRKGRLDGFPIAYEQLRIGLSLFDLEADPGETTDVAELYPDVLDDLIRRAMDEDAQLRRDARPHKSRA